MTLYDGHRLLPAKPVAPQLTTRAIAIRALSAANDAKRRSVCSGYHVLMLWFAISALAVRVLLMGLAP